MQQPQGQPAQITEEQLRNMTPEQIQELQKQNCIFCHIISGKVNSRKIYEDDKVCAILDINPGNPGHILLLPKEHYSIMPQIPEPDVGYIFMVAKALSNTCLRALKCHGTNIFVANGVAAGQKAPHFMIHIIPRKDGDGLTSFSIPEKKLSEIEFDALYEKLKKAVDELLGVKGKEVIDMDKPGEEEASQEPEEVVKEEEKQEQKEEGVKEPEQPEKPLEESEAEVFEEEPEALEAKDVEPEKKPEPEPAEAKSPKKTEKKDGKGPGLDELIG